MRARTSTPATLYLCYFAIDQPLVQTQVLPYLQGIAEAGWRVHLLTFEASRWPRTRAERVGRELDARGIRWHWTRYHKHPAAKLWDVARGAAVAAWLVRRHGIRVLHARSHVPLVIARLARYARRCRLLFDLRGLIAEEYADAGLWRPGSAAFRAVKAAERWGFDHADEIVVLTERMRDRLLAEGSVPAARLTVIPCCTRVPPAVRRTLGCPPDERVEVVYVGSVGGLYLLEDMARFVQALRSIHDNASFTVLTRAAPDEVSRLLGRAGLPTGRFSVIAAPPEAVHSHLERASIGISFRAPTASQVAASPTKVGEYLSAGLPFVTSAGIGDLDAIIQQDRVGVVVRQFDWNSLTSAAHEARQLLREPGLAERCLSSARRRYDIDGVGLPRYRAIYQRLRGGAGSAASCGTTE